MKVMITGANGFIGSPLVKEIIKRGHSVCSAVRKNDAEDKATSQAENVEIGEIGPQTDWLNSLKSVEVIVHLAAVTHQKALSNDESLFKQVNIDGTKRLLEDAIRSGVKRFIFISSIKVYGEKRTQNGFLNRNAETPEILDEESKVGLGCDSYGLSKLIAENEIQKLCQQSSIEFVIIRPPLVYGPNVGANFKSLLALINTGIPLPFAGINNRRSMIAIDNIVDFICCCVIAKKAANQVYLISDDDDISLSRLISLSRRSMNIRARLFFTPISVLRVLFFVIGKNKEFDKLTTSFQISPNKARKQLGWRPIIRLEKAINQSVKGFLKNK